MKAIVIGSPGSGKSTFSRKLSVITNIPLYHLDLIWYKEDKTNITEKEFDTQLNLILKTDSWIIDGNYSRTLEMRFKHCDIVYLLDYSLDVCLQGVSTRVGSKRLDLPWVEESFDKEFKKFIIDFPDTELPKINSLIDKYKDKKIIIFKSHDEANEFLDKCNKLKNVLITPETRG